MLSRCVLDFSEGVVAFVIGLSQISSFFLLNIRYRLNGRGLLYFSVCPFYIKAYAVIRKVGVPKPV